MGRNAGDIALWAGIASGLTKLLCQKKNMTSTKWFVKLKKVMNLAKNLTTLLCLLRAVMGAEEFAAKMKEAGDTSDLRATNLGHVIRGGSPTARDRVLASWMGAHAVDLLKEGIGGVAVGIHNEQLVESPTLVQQKKVLCSVLLKTVKLS